MLFRSAQNHIVGQGQDHGDKYLDQDGYKDDALENYRQYKDDDKNKPGVASFHGVPPAEISPR